MRNSPRSITELIRTTELGCTFCVLNEIWVPSSHLGQPYPENLHNISPWHPAHYCNDQTKHEAIIAELYNTMPPCWILWNFWVSSCCFLYSFPSCFPIRNTQFPRFIPSFIYLFYFVSLLLSLFLSSEEWVSFPVLFSQFLCSRLLVLSH